MLELRAKTTTIVEREGGGKEDNIGALSPGRDDL